MNGSNSGGTAETFVSSSPGEHTSLYIPEYDLTNNGYGPAYFFKGVIDFNLSTSAILGNSATYFCLDAWNYKQSSGFTGYGGIYATTYNPSVNGASYNKFWFVSNGYGSGKAVRLEQVKKWSPVI